MPAELAFVRADCADFAFKDGADIDAMVRVITHNQKEFSDPMWREADTSVLQVVERPRRAEVARIHDD